MDWDDDLDFDADDGFASVRARELGLSHGGPAVAGGASGSTSAEIIAAARRVRTSIGFTRLPDLVVAVVEAHPSPLTASDAVASVRRVLHRVGRDVVPARVINHRLR